MMVLPVCTPVGDGKLLDNGKRASFQVKEGDRLLFTSYAGNEVTVDGESGVVAGFELKGRHGAPADSATVQLVAAIAHSPQQGVVGFQEIAGRVSEHDTDHIGFENTAKPSLTGPQRLESLVTLRRALRELALQLVPRGRRFG
jgi:hypothetical protein